MRASYIGGSLKSKRITHIDPTQDYFKYCLLKQCRKMTKSNYTIFFLIIMGILLGGYHWVYETFHIWGFVFPLFLYAVGFGLFLLIENQQSSKRIQRLRRKYSDPELVEKIISGTIWYRQSLDELIDAIGLPVEISYEVMKVNKREIWKYEHQGGAQYNLIVTLENDKVISWERY